MKTTAANINERIKDSNEGRTNVRIIVRGKKQIDKRDIIKKRDVDREIRRRMKS